MFQKISLSMEDFYSLKGRIGRLDFFLGLLSVGIIVSAIYYFLKTYALESNNADLYFISRALTQILVLLLSTPFYVKRFHDLNSSGFWMLLLWIVLPFSFEGAYLADTYFDFHINPFNEFILILEVMGLLMLAVLLLKSGNPDSNRWGNPDKRLPSD